LFNKLKGTFDLTLSYVFLFN